MTDADRPDPPSGFVEAWVGRLAAAHAGRRALDVATGRGRHAAILARAGYRTFAIDRAFGVLSETRRRLAAHGLHLSAWCGDLTMGPLPPGAFDLIVVTRYLQRDLCPAIADALAPGGTLLYETFIEAQRQLGRGPTSPEHLLASGELRDRFAQLECVFYEEAGAPEAVARLVARASSSRS